MIAVDDDGREECPRARARARKRGEGARAKEMRRSMGASRICQTMDIYGTRRTRDARRVFLASVMGEIDIVD